VVARRTPYLQGTPMADYTEEKTFDIHIRLSAAFGPEYEGDDDGYAWLEQWERDVKPRLVQAVFTALRADARFATVPGARGASPDDALEINVRFKPGAR
jgi:hypothetical protein